jgi:AbrB family looped-hinge helix DNA binding protein
MAEFAVTTISSKHQITLPAALVRQLGLQPGDKLSVRLEDHRIALERQPRTPDEWVQRFSGALAARPYWGSKEEIDEYVRKEREGWRERDERLTS